MYINDNPRGIFAPRGRGMARGGFSGVLGLESSNVGPNLGVVPMAIEEFAHPGARITEQRTVDEVDGRGRAFDVQQDGADLPQRDAARSGM